MHTWVVGRDLRGSGSARCGRGCAWRREPGRRQRSGATGGGVASGETRSGGSLGLRPSMASAEDGAGGASGGGDGGGMRSLFFSMSGPGQEWRARWAELDAKMTATPLVITVSQPTKTGDYYARRHVTYLVTTRTYGFVVRRRYSDFEWLRNVLVARFPGMLVPSLPPKEIKGAAFKNASDDPSASLFIQMRMQLLRHFVNGLSAIPFVRSDASLLAFLSCQGDRDWQAAKESTAKATLMTDIAEGTSLWKGAVANCDMPTSWDRTIHDFRRQLDVIESCLRNLRKALDALTDGSDIYSKSQRRVYELLAEFSASEAEFGDASKFEYVNKDEVGAQRFSGSAAQAYHPAHVHPQPAFATSRALALAPR